VGGDALAKNAARSESLRRGRVRSDSGAWRSGFDFFGEFRLPPPLAYRVPMKGEVKRYDPRANGVGRKEVARLQCGEHGVFVASSYFTTQPQEEVFEDRYPVELIYGRRLLGLLTSAGAIREGALDPSWLTDG
jgi:hypothetical protein